MQHMARIQFSFCPGDYKIKARTFRIAFSLLFVMET